MDGQQDKMLLEGDTSADVAWQCLKNESNSYLIDVRTDWERDKYGAPDLSSINKTLICLSFVDDDGIINPDFSETLLKLVEDKGAMLFFICKTGYRSKLAAEAASVLGYGNAVNILGGVEGSSTTKGWKGLKLSCGDL